MFRYRIPFVVFLAGLAAVCWVGAGYATTNPLAFAVTVLIGACYTAGAAELQRYQRATETLAHAVDGLTETPAELGSWISRLHPSLRGAVRLRIEGERAVLPGPSLSPYLAGLLVLLGMLGTLLGMVATLRGTGTALDSATDLQAMRASLAAPVKGLGFAFGTSIAGVASSAMLGLLSALCRRERTTAAQHLDAKIASTLRVYSLAHQREQTFGLMQQQSALMPALIERLQSMMDSIERRTTALDERALTSQHSLHERIETAYARLASSVEQSLTQSVTENARVVGTALQPVVAATMAGLSQETAALRETVSVAVRQQLDGLTAGFDAATAQVAQTWKQALAEHQQVSGALSGELRTSVDQLSQSLEQRTTGLLEGVCARLDATTAQVARSWSDALTQQTQANDASALRHTQTLAAAAETADQQTGRWLDALRESHERWHAELKASEAQRVLAWHEALDGVSARISATWDEAGARRATREQEICDTLARTASEISAQSHAHARETIAEVEKLVALAAQAPKAAAEVVAELRQKLTDSMVRDTAMLEERARLLQTVETLLDAVNHASTEQRAAVDTLVTTSADLLDRVGTQFSERVDSEASRLDVAAAELTGSAVEVASLGEAMGAAVEVFGASNDAMLAQLQRIEAALDKSVSRSDEQLAYYVAQAREVIDLCMLSQKQMIEEMQALTRSRAPAGAPAA